MDARPPWADANRENYDFKREDCSCAADGNPSTVTRIQAYDVTKWIANLKTLAGLGASIGVDNILGIDIYNEPWDYSWSEWKSLIEQAYSAINSVNPNILIFAEGIGGSSGNQDGTPTTTTKSPHGNETTTNPNWGENLYEAGTTPPAVPKNRIVFSPHCYGPSVCTQPMFADVTAQPECAGLVEDAFGNAKCKIVIDPAKLEIGWEEHFGYLRALGYAVCIGEFGGNMDWPNKSESRMQSRYSYLTDKTTDQQWQEAFVNYLIKKNILNSFYWSINPESSDTYGIYSTPYDPISNTGGWGTWSGTDSRKLTMLAKLWNATESGISVPSAKQASQSLSQNVSLEKQAGTMRIASTYRHPVSVQFMDVAGRCVFARELSAFAAVTVSTDILHSGYYVMQVNEGSAVRSVQRIMLTK